LTNKHQACPACGGKDRFRFDDKEGRGTYICSNCGAGDGVDLLQKYTGWGFAEAAQFTEDTLGIKPKPRQSKAPARIAINSPQQAVEVFSSLPIADSHPYLHKKQIKPHVARLNGTELLIPIHSDLNGTLHSVERIFADSKEKGQYRKLAVKGTDKKGKFCIIGDMTQDMSSQVVVLTEGYATGATVHELTDCPVLVCFGAGNLWPVAEGLRQAFPDVGLLIAADGGDVGKQKALAVAQRFNGLAITPDFMGYTAGGDDFNDLVVCGGRTEAKQQLQDALDNVPKPSEEGTKPAFKIMQGKLKARVMIEGEANYFTLCDRLEVNAATRDQYGLNHGRLLSFSVRGGKAREWVMPMQMLAGEPAKLIGQLLSMGLYITAPHESKSCKQIVQYINAQYPPEVLTTTESTGWHGNTFVLTKGEIIGKGDRIIFAGDNSELYSQQGNLTDWQNHVARLAGWNSRLIFAVSMAFVGVMMPLTGDDGAGVNFFGETSTGKTTTQVMAASVWGNPVAGSFISKWNATATGLEIQAVQRNHTLFCIDELGEVDPKAAGRLIYQLASGVQKGRGRSSDQGIGLADLKKWRMPFISSAEKTLQQHVEGAGERLYGGQAVRCVDIPADAGAECGVFEHLHGLLEQFGDDKRAAGAAFSDLIKANCQKHYGTAGRAFIDGLLKMGKTQALQFIEQQRAAFSQQHIPADASNIARRAAKLFSLTAATGELAIKLGILPNWEAGTAIMAAGVCFSEWLKHSGGGNPEERAALKQVQYFIESNKENFRCLSESNDVNDRRNIPRQVGFVNADQSVFYIMPAIFERDTCRDFSHKFVIETLKKHGLLRHEKGRNKEQLRIEGQAKNRFYAVSYLDDFGES